METTMVELRSFVHQRLFSAAEEILGEVQKTVTLALYQAEVSRSKEELERLRHQLDLLRNKPAEEPSLTGSTVGNGSSPPGASQTSTEPERMNWNHCMVQTDFKRSEIKEEPEEPGEDALTEPSHLILTMTAEPSVEGGDQNDAPSLGENPESSTPEESNMSLAAELPGREGAELRDVNQTQQQDHSDAQISYDMQPLSSDFSADESENNDCSEELVNSNGKQTKAMNRKRKTQSGTKNEKQHAALAYDNAAAKSERGSLSSCHVCGKGFHYRGSLIKHIKTHEETVDCAICGKKYQSKQKLDVHLKSHRNTTCFCGKPFSSVRCLRLHEKVHAGEKDFTCHECGKTFTQNAQLIVHTRSHSAEKLYKCDVCGKEFSHSHILKVHKISHLEEKPYRCDVCGKNFNIRSRLQIHMRFHLTDAQFQCDICGMSFIKNRQMVMHRTMHTGERPHGCNICGMGYRFSSGLQAHMKIHANE
ncbi:zinc finger protein 391-like [Centropristis striata]|uniref:zinc finger protein 391-like n=1 Tax=Centropristis striata TaxID=184440 RepID=UPI0027DEFDFC|nr:zinc finger protein 391-like [Centropristis striata]